jgi:CRP/FNR family transcriptional regulator
VQLHKLSPDGQEVVVKVVRPGELFAEVVLFERAKYPVTAVTLENVQLLEMPRVCVRRLLGNETFRDDFIAMLIARQRYLAQRLMEQQSYDVEERLVLFLREQYGEVTEIQTALSKKAIAAAISTTPETLSRVIRRLQDRGVLTWSGRAIHLPESFWAAYRDVG